MPLQQPDAVVNDGPLSRPWVSCGDPNEFNLALWHGPFTGILLFNPLTLA